MKWLYLVQRTHEVDLGAVALTVGSVPRRIVPELRHFHWLLKMNNQSNWRSNTKTILRGTDPTASATATGRLVQCRVRWPLPADRLTTIAAVGTREQLLSIPLRIPLGVPPLPARTETAHTDRLGDFLQRKQSAITQIVLHNNNQSCIAWQRMARTSNIHSVINVLNECLPRCLRLTNCLGRTGNYEDVPARIMGVYLNFTSSLSMRGPPTCRSTQFI